MRVGAFYEFYSPRPADSPRAALGIRPWGRRGVALAMAFRRISWRGDWRASWRRGFRRAGAGERLPAWSSAGAGAGQALGAAACHAGVARRPAAPVAPAC